MFYKSLNFTEICQIDGMILCMTYHYFLYSIAPPLLEKEPLKQQLKVLVYVDYFLYIINLNCLHKFCNI